MDDQSGGHVVAACGKALMKVPATGLISASYSTRVSPMIYTHVLNRGGHGVISPLDNL